MSSLSRDLAEYADGISFDEFDEAVVDTTSDLLYDTIGCSIGAFTSPPAKALRAEYEQAGESLSEAVVEFYGYETPTAEDTDASSPAAEPFVEAEPESDDATADDGDDVHEDMVACQVCGEYYQAITESHLQTHDMSMQEYKDEHGPDATIYPGEE